MEFTPSYISMLRSGELARRLKALEALLESCTVCPHECGNNRLKDELARCHTGYLPVVSSYTAHFGEEPLLVGTGGTGNIFFGNCNLRCVYCQNHLISQNHREERSHAVTFERLAEIMLELQDRGCHEIGLVSPGHVVPQILRALVIAAGRGLHLPLIYNTNAYDSIEVLRLLDGVIDIYLPDLKYSDEGIAAAYSGVHAYPAVARAAIREMHRQVGNSLVLGEDGLVKRGLIIRHLVLPNDLAGSRESLRWVREQLGPSVTLSIMAQYYPAHRAANTPLLDRTIREGEYHRVLETLERLGLEEGWIQEAASQGYYRPEFCNRDAPFAGGPDNREDAVVQGNLSSGERRS